MLTLQDQAELFAELRRDGASTFEAVEVILAAQEVSNAIELGSKAWEHELRDSHGRFASSGAVTGSRVEARQRRRAAHQAAGRIHTPAQERPATMKQLAVAQTQTMAIAHESARKAMADAVKQARDIHSNFLRESEKEEGHKSFVKSMAIIGSLIAGALLGWLANKMGQPDITQIGATLGPSIAEALFEWKKRL